MTRYKFGLLAGLFVLIVSFTPIFAQQAQEVSLAPLDFGILQTVVTIGNTATAIPTTALKGRKTLIIKNLDTSVVIYLGSVTVTANENSTGGYPLAYRDSVTIDLGENTVIYGICSSSAKVSIIEVR